jgi:hypothetical protein
MRTDDTARSLAHLFSELVDGVTSSAGGFILNKGDTGLLKSLAHLSAADASRSTDDGATIAAHAQHVRYGLSLMNEWASKGGNPFANAKWDEAWKIKAVDEDQWKEIRQGLADEAHRWNEVLKTPREANGMEFTGLVSSIGHLAYHLGAIRQIARSARGPREGVFTQS